MPTKKIAKKITFDLSVLSNLIESGDQLMINRDAEEFIVKYKTFLDSFDTLVDEVKKKILSVMQKENTLKLEGEEVVLSMRMFGEKYELTDPDVALGMGMATEETKIKADSAAIDKYIKENDEMPEGVKLKERTQSVVITLKK